MANNKMQGASVKFRGPFGARLQRTLAACTLMSLCGLLAITGAHAQSSPGETAQKPALREIPAAEKAFARGIAFPAWVDRIESIPEATSTDPYVLRLTDVHFHVDKEPTMFAHRAIQANDASALAGIGQHEIVFQPEYQRVQLHLLRIRRGTQVIDKLSSANIRFLQREPELDYGIYTGSVSATIVTDDVRVGDTLEIAYSLIGQNPVFAGKFFNAAVWDSPYPARRRRITLDMPDNKSIHYRVIGAELKGNIQPVERRTAGRRIVRFEATDLPATDTEPYVPNDFQQLRWIQFSEFQTWREVTQWASNLFDAPVSPAALKEALTTARSARDQREAVSKALEFVQNEIRYLSIALGENSHRPFAPDQVLVRRYGDCKDKSLLLVSMLRQLGIEAAPVLVSTYYRKGLDKMLPSPLVFDHAIVRVVVQGKTYFLDPTRLGQYGDLDRMGQTHGSVQALVIAANSDNLTRISQGDNDDLITNTRTERVLVKRLDEPVHMTVQLQYAGTDAESARRSIALYSTQQLRKAYEENLGRRYPGAELISPPTVTDNRKENRLTIDLQYRVPNFFEPGKSHWIIRYQPSNLRELFYIPGNAKRNYPLLVPTFPSVNRYEFELTLPEDFDANYRPEDKTLNSAAFSLSESLSFSGRVARAKLELKVLAERVEPKDVIDFLADSRKAGEMLQGTLYIKHSDQKTPAANVQPPLPLKQAVRERLERSIQATSKVIADAKLTGRDASTALCERALAAAYLGRNAEAIADVQHASRQQSASPDILRCRGDVYFVTGDFKNSETDFSRAMALGMRDGDIYLRRGLSNYYLGMSQAAADDFAQASEKAAGATEKTRADIWHMLAQRQANPTAAASTSAKAALKEEWPHAALGLFSNQQTPEAMLRIVHKESGEELDASLAEAYFYIGQYYLMSDEKLKANVFFRRATDKGVLYSHYHLSARHELTRLSK